VCLLSRRPTIANTKAKKCVLWLRLLLVTTLTNQF
ncbi:phosphoenolpyruvate-dependent sugar phosphotransferase system, EIIA 2 family protein, partial [Vibrio parahaemolyticus V-223/04]